MSDVVIAGGGPAGCIAGIVLARAGARVLMLDRARFPRAKLCGDSLNPGTLALLRRLGLAEFADREGHIVHGMIVTSESGRRVEARYPGGTTGRAIARREFDAWLLERARAAGVEFEDATRVVGAALQSTTPAPPRVLGLVTERGRSASRTRRAGVTIAADGRRSVVAFGLGLARHPAWPRRWAVGGYFERACGLSTFAEMHIRRDSYFGLAPLPGGVVNACLVTPDLRALGAYRDTGALLRGALAGDAHLGPRFAGARLVERPIALGPLAVDVAAAGVPGLLLAGDAAGFIDPMTGDGLYFAMRGGELAAQAALRALSGDTQPHVWLAEQRRREFGWKRAFNRAVRSFVAVPLAVTAASHLAHAAPSLVHRVVSYAGDVGRQ